jgi:energy-coupling factor transporter ATP-binding protein EcfA2
MIKPVKHLRVSRLWSEKSLRNIKLTNLVALNLLAGKNGAGKSTLLAALNKQLGQVKTGVLIQTAADNATLDWVGEVFNHLEIQDKWNQVIEAEAIFVDQFGYEPKSLEFIASLKSIYFSKISSSSEPQFFPEVYDEFLASARQLKNQANMKVGAYIQDISSILELIYKHKLEGKLIPAQRALSTKAKNGVNYECLPSGEGLINRLFELKSKSKGSEDWLRYQGLQKVFRRVSGGVAFEVVLDSEQNLHIEFGFGRKTAWIQSPQTGTGFADLLVLIYWISKPGLDILLVEEPENHLHPKLQLSLAAYVSELTDRVVIMATHSSHLVNAAVEKRVFWTEYKESLNGGEISVSDETTVSSMVTELGASATEYLGSSILVLTEGPSDQIAIREFLRQMKAGPLHEICFISLGGDSMQHFEFGLLKQKFKIMALIDQDPSSKKVRDVFMNNCGANQVQCFQLEKYALENYFSIQAYKKVFPNRVLPDAVPSDKKISDSFGFSPKRNIEQLAKNTLIGDLNGTQLEIFLNNLKNALELINSAQELAQ